jgi:hypothetical protein
MPYAAPLIVGVLHEMKMNMKYKIMAVLLVLSFTGISYAETGETVPYRALDGELSSYICIERPENMGLLNIIPTKALFSNEQTLTLTGGEAACIIVSPGKYSFTVTSPEPYPQTDKGNGLWKSDKIELNITKDQMLVFKLVPSSNDKGYSGKWELQKLK